MELTEEEIKELRIGIREYIEKMFLYSEKSVRELEKLMELKFYAIDERLKTSGIVLEARLLLLNEFKAAMMDQQNTFLTIKEHQLWKETIENRMSSFSSFKDVVEAKASQRSVNISYVISAIGIALAIISMAIR